MIRLVLLCAGLLVAPAAAARAPDPVVIRFEGNELFARGELLGLAGWRDGGPLASLDLGAGLRRVAEAYAASGYLGVELTPDTARADGRLVLSIAIREGERARIRSFEVRGVEALDRAEARSLLGVRRGDVFQPSRIEEGINRLLGRYAEIGFPYAQALVDRVDRVGPEIDLGLYVSEGGTKTIGAIEFEGLEKVRESAAASWTGLSPGQPYNGAALDRAAGRLARTGLFEEVRPPEVFLMEHDRVGVLFVVREQKRTNRLGGILGVSQEAQDEAASLSGQVDALLPNLGGTGRSIEVHWKDDGQGRSVTRVAFSQPRFLDLPFDASLELRRVHQDSLSTWQSFGLDLRYPLGLAWTLSGGYSVDRDVFEEGPTAKTLRQRGRLGLRFEPVRLVGPATFGVRVTIEAARKSRSSRGTAGPAGDERQLLYAAGLYDLLTLSGPHHVYVRADARGTLSDEIALPLTEQYYIGGATTLRGYREDQFHGRQVAHGTLEYRLGDRIGNQIFLFTDVGAYAVRDSVAARDVWTSKVGYGFGVRSRSALGRVELSFGLGEAFSLQSTKVHVSLVRTF